MNPTTKLVFNSRRLLFAVIACLLLVGCLTTRIQDAIAPLPATLVKIGYLADSTDTNITRVVDRLLTVTLPKVEAAADATKATADAARKGVPWLVVAVLVVACGIVAGLARVVHVLIGTADETLIDKTRQAWGNRQRESAPKTQRIIRQLLKLERWLKNV